jgi:hypothetical protein
LTGQPLRAFPNFLAYEATFTAGVDLTIGDVNGDGLPDIITVPSYGTADVRVFLNQYDSLDLSKPAFVSKPAISFQAFPLASMGGAVVVAADLGRWNPETNAFVQERDGQAEIVVGTGGGTTTMVSVFTLQGTIATRVKTFSPFAELNPNFLGGVSLDIAQFEQDSPPAIIAGMGVNGTSRIEVWGWEPAAMNPFLWGTIPKAFSGSSSNAPVHVAAATDPQGLAYAIYAVQGPIGNTREIHRFDVSAVSPTLQFEQAAPLSGFQGPWFIAAHERLPPAASSRTEADSRVELTIWTNSAQPHDVNQDGLTTPLDVLELINYINSHPGQTALPSEPLSPQRFLDANADLAISAVDVLVVLNDINRVAAGEGESQAYVPLPDTRLVSSEEISRELSHASSQAHDARDQAFAQLARNVPADTVWNLPAVDELAAPRFRSWRFADDLDHFDWETVFDEAVPQYAAHHLASSPQLAPCRNTSPWLRS